MMPHSAQPPDPTPADFGAPLPARVRVEQNYGGWRNLGAGERRAVIRAFFNFARLADDIADDHRLDSVARVARLDALDGILTGRETGGPGGAARGATGPAAAAAFELRRRLTEASLPIEHARHLLQACRADAGNRPCRTWSDLLAYCRYGAAPIARFVIDAHGERIEAVAAAEALAGAFHILNLVQDCKLDYMALRRVYLPAEWMSAAGIAPHELGQDTTSPALRSVFDRVLDGVAQLQAAAAPLPRLVATPKLRLEAHTLLRLTARLSARLRREDPLAHRVALSTWDKIAARAGARFSLLLG